MYNKILILLTSFIFVVQTSYSSSALLDADPRNVNPVLAAGAIATAHSDADSVLSDHESDDDTLKEMVAEARDLGFSADSNVKKTLRGKRHERKIEIASAKVAEREAKRAAFLAKIGGTTESKVYGPPSCGAGAGAGSASATDIAVLTNPSVERLAWMAVGLNRRAENILQAIGAIQAIDKSERVAFAQKLKKLIAQNGFMGEGLSLFMEVSKDLTSVNRYALMSDLENLACEGFVLNLNNIRALAKQAGKSKGFLIETLRRFRALVGLKKEDQWHGDIQDIIDIDTIIKVSPDEMSGIIESACKIAAPFIFANDKKYKLFPYTMRIFASIKRENRKTFEEMIFKRLESDMHNILGRAKTSTVDACHLVIEEEFYRILNEVSLAAASLK